MSAHHDLLLFARIFLACPTNYVIRIYFLFFCKREKFGVSQETLTRFFRVYRRRRRWERPAFKEHPWEKLRLPFISTAYILYNILLYVLYICTYSTVTVSSFFNIILINWHNYRSILSFWYYYYCYYCYYFFFFVDFKSETNVLNCELNAVIYIYTRLIQRCGHQIHCATDTNSGPVTQLDYNEHCSTRILLYVY
jgi:hypothetical protein